MKDLLTANNSGKFWRELGPAIKLCDLTIACRSLLKLAIERLCNISLQF